MRKLVVFATFVMTLIASLALADSSPIISPQSIVVNPSPSFNVNVWVDKDTSGNSRPSYTIGEPIQISVSVSQASYVYVFDLNAAGEITQILPNRLSGGRDNHLQAGETRTFPSSGANFRFNIGGPVGLDKVIALASTSKLDTSQLAQFQASGNFASSNQGESSFAKTLSIIVTPIPQQNWVTDTALFYVVRGNQPPPPPTFGTLAINSNPNGAAAYVDSQFVGYTPVNFGTTAGQHTVRLELDGYVPYQTTVTVQGGQTAQVYANLSPGQQSGTLILNVNVGGASVFIDGNYVGAVANGSGRFVMSGLNVGQHTLRVSAPGYNDINTGFTIRAGQTTQLSFTMPQVQAPGNHFWVARLSLRGYPGATLTKTERRGNEVHLRFDSRASLNEAYGYFDRELAAGGWKRVSLQSKGPASKLEASYRHAGSRVSLHLDQKGRSGHYTLALDFSE